MPPTRVAIPDPLRQKFLPNDCGFEFNYSAFPSYLDGNDCEVKYLMDCTGEFTRCIALYSGSCLSIRELIVNSSVLRYSFNDDLVIADVEYFRNSENEMCLLVALNSLNISAHPHCVALLRWSGLRFLLVRKVRIEQEISCLKVIADEQTMNQIQHTLHPKMAVWPHIVAIGTRYAHCYIISIEPTDRHHDNDPNETVTMKLTDGLKPFHKGGYFFYDFAETTSGHIRSTKMVAESIFVSCISFLERCRVVLIGFSFGGIVSVSLSSTPTIEPLLFPCTAPVHFITPLEPDDDPRMHLWFFVAYGTTKTKPLQLCLFEVMFNDEESMPVSQRTWNKPIYGIKLIIPFENSTRWVSIQTLVRDRSELKNADDSTRDSFRFGPEKDRSMVFFAYVAATKNGAGLKGGIFDLNAYFYKRLPNCIIQDNTAAHQCAFMSIVFPIPMQIKEEDFSELKDAAVDTGTITRFTSNVSDAEQMFYPSTFEIRVVHVAGCKKCYQLSLPSLPNQLLSMICADLETHFGDASSASAWLAALGLHKNEPQVGSPEQSNICCVLSTLISHHRAGSVVQFIKQCNSAESRHLIAAWIWNEIHKASKTMHETTEPLFARFSGPLNPAGQKSLAHLHHVFKAGVVILRELVDAAVREGDETKEYVTTLEAQRFAAENLYAYSLVIRQLINSKMLPVAEDREVRLALENSLKERRIRANVQLNVDKLVSRMQRKCPTEPFWRAESPQWYPPALLNLLAPILILNIPIKWKGQLLAFYLIDYASCKAVQNGAVATKSTLLEVVIKQMHGILNMTKKDLEEVYDMWCADNNLIEEQVSPPRPQIVSTPQRLTSDKELRDLFNMPRPLTACEEDKLKSLLKSTHFGEYAWNCYLVRNRKFDQLVELPIPPNSEENEIVQEYRRLMCLAKKLRTSAEYSASMRPSWPAHIKDAINKRDNSKLNSDCETPVLSRGKTPIRLQRGQPNPIRKRLASLAQEQQSVISPQTSSQSDKSTPPAKRVLLNCSDDEVIIPKGIPENALNSITDILRTPSARACAAARAESQRKWRETTPQAEAERPVPRSILKSGKAVPERVGLTPRNRLHFDLPSSSTSSIEQTGSDQSTEPVERMKQPNFDDSLDENMSNLPNDERLDKMVHEDFVPYVSPDHNEREAYPVQYDEVQPEEFEELVHEKDARTPPVVQDNGDVLEKSFEVQEDEDQQHGADIENEWRDKMRNVISTREQQEDDAVESVVEIITEKQDEWEHSEAEVQTANEDVMECGEAESLVESMSHSKKHLQGNEHSVQTAVDVERLVDKRDIEDLNKHKFLITKEIQEEFYEEKLERKSAKGRGSGKGAWFNEAMSKEVQGDFEISTAVGGSAVGNNENDALNDQYSKKRREVHHELVRSTGAGGDENEEGERFDELDLEISKERQEDSHGVNATYVIRPANVAVETVIESPSSKSTVNPCSEAQVGQVTGIGAVTPVLEQQLEVQDDDVDAVVKGDFIPQRLATGDYVCVSSESVTTAHDDSTTEVSQVKLVDYSYTDSTFDCTNTASKLRKAASSTLDDFVSQKPLLNVDDAVPVVTADERQSDGCSSSSSDHLDLAALDDIVTAPVTPPSSPQSLQPVSSAKKQRSAKKGVRAPTVDTPTRRSRRLRGEDADADLNEEITASQEKVEEETLADSETTRLSSPARKNKEVPSTPQLTMSLRKRARQDSDSAEVGISLPASNRKTPTRRRKTSVEAEDMELGEEQHNVELTLESSVSHRKLRERTPTLSKQEELLSTPLPKTSRRTQSATRAKDQMEEKSTPKSLSRTPRTRKFSSSSEGQSTSSAIMPSRVGSRSTSRNLQIEQQVATRKPVPRAVKALTKKVAAPSLLTELDPRAYYDGVNAGTSRVEGGRRRSMSDSGVLDVSAKRLRQKKTVNTIVEVDETPGDDPNGSSSNRVGSSNRATAGRSVSAMASTRGAVQSPSRGRRTASATPVEITPTRLRTRKTSEASSDITPAMSKSPSRRGRSKKIESIPE